MNRHVLLTIAILVLIPFLIKGIPWRLSYPNSTRMLLFNHEVGEAATTQRILFFNAGVIHSFFPLTYVFARVFFLLVPSPVLIEFVSPAVITFILLAATSIIWLRNLPSAYWYLAWFGLGSLVLLYLGDLSSWLWFSSIGLWELLVFLCLLRFIRGTSVRNRSVSLIAFILLLSMLLGDDGIAFFVAIFALLVYAGLSRPHMVHYLRWVLLSAVMLLSYERAIGFSGELYYASYLPILQQQLSDMLSFNPPLATHLGRLSLPLFQTVGLGIAFLIMFGIVPIMLFGNLLKQGLRPKSLLLPAIILVAGVTFRLSNVVTAQPVYVGALYGYALYLVLPVAVLATVHAKLETNRTFERSQTHKYKYIFFLTVSLSILVIATFQTNPLIATGKINSIVDPRVEPTYVQAAGVYASRFLVGPLATTQISDISVLLVGPQNVSSNYLLTSTLPSPYAQQFALGSAEGLYYTNGPIVIVGK